MSTVNEGSTSFITITFRDQTGVAVTPSAGRYRLDKAGEVVKSWTAFAPSSSSYIITVTGAENTISGSDPTEAMRVTVEWTYDTDKTGTMDLTYTIVSLEK